MFPKCCSGSGRSPCRSNIPDALALRDYSRDPVVGTDRAMLIAAFAPLLLVEVDRHIANSQTENPGRPRRDHVNKSYLRRVRARGSERRLIWVQCESNVSVTR